MSGLIGHAERAGIATRLDEVFGDLGTRAVARRIGCDATNVSRWRNKKSLPDAPSLLAVQREFGVSIDWVLSGRGEPYPTTASEEDGE